MRPSRSDAARYGAHLLRQLGWPGEPVGEADDPELAWRRAGLLDLTGRQDGPGLVCPAALAAAADGALMALRSLAARPERLPASGALLLGERARLMGLQRAGRVSANGSCRLLEAADGRVALNLAREEDWSLAPILLGCDEATTWAEVEAGATALPAAELVERGVELGMAIALDAPPGEPGPLFTPAPPQSEGARDRPVVVDLSALWAGPLAGALFAALGAEVIKVEATARPDGARFGHPGFYDLVNGGKRSVALDFASAEGRAALTDLIARADIVIEGSRPRALRRLGIDRDAAVARGAVWIGITAHAGEPDRVGFGDDAAVAAGLANLMERAWGEPLFVGDAIADPLTGIHAALGGWAAWRAGGGRLVELSLAGVVAHALTAGVAEPEQLAEQQARAEADRGELYPLRRPIGPAAAFGADTRRVLAGA